MTTVQEEMRELKLDIEELHERIEDLERMIECCEEEGEVRELNDYLDMHRDELKRHLARFRQLRGRQNG